MCGILGSVNNNIELKDFKLSLDKLSRRGPDDQSTFFYENILLGHTRLSIQDLSSGANQPFHSSKGDLVIVFNGEIYNHLDLRKQHLKNHTFRTHSDTETLIELISLMGINEAINYLEGMFAFGLIDLKNDLVYLCRDINGEKPLYYSMSEKGILFSSDISSLEGFVKNLTLNKKAFNLYTELNYIPEPYSIYNEINKISKGCYHIYKFDNDHVNLIEIKQFNEFRVTNNSLNFDDAVKKTDYLLSNSVKKMLISDVPVGALLSGGIDSSLVVSYMSEHSSSPVNTFTVGSRNANYDESTRANKISKYLGTSHNELIVNASELVEIISEIPNAYSEPFADASQLPTMIICKLTSEKVKVVLSGDGGDELFGGYNRYVSYENIVSNFYKRPKYQKFLASSFLNSLNESKVDSIFTYLNRFLPSRNVIPIPGQKIRKLRKAFNSNSREEYFMNIVSNNEIIPEVKEYMSNYLYRSKLEDFSQSMMLTDIETYLSNDILVKIDRASMHYSLESRVPFLDKELINFAISLPSNYKIDNRGGKIILKSLVESRLKKDLFSGAKTGFGIPISEWLKGELYDWAKELISYENIKKSKVYDYKYVNSLLDSHKQGKSCNEVILWNILMFQLWYLAKCKQGVIINA